MQAIAVSLNILAEKRKEIICRNKKNFVPLHPQVGIARTVVLLFTPSNPTAVTCSQLVRSRISRCSFPITTIACIPPCTGLVAQLVRATDS